MTLPTLNKEMKVDIKERFEMKVAPKGNINIQNVLLVDAHFQHKKVNICKICREDHKKGCCDAYDRANRSKSESIMNIELIVPNPY